MTSARLKDLAIPTGLVGGPFGSSLVSADYTRSGVPVIRGENLNAGKWIGGQFVFVSEDKLAADLARNTARPGDVVFTQRGTLGQVALVPSGMADQFVVSQSQMRLRVDETRALAAFLYYACTAPEFLQQIDDRAIATGVPHINLGILGSLEVPLPPLRIQRAIAEVLGALDDKIAANATLSASADALVRVMFDEFTASNESVRIGDLATNPRAGAKPPFDAGHYVGLEHVPRRLMWLTETGDAEGLASGKFEFARDDVLFGKLRPYFHKVVVADRAGVCSTDILVVRPCSETLRGFVWAAAASDSVVGRVSAMSEGTRMPRTDWNALASSEVPWPGRVAAEVFSERVVALRDRVAAGIAESACLANLRDTLLPHLMSGRITVREAEEQVEEVL